MTEQTSYKQQIEDQIKLGNIFPVAFHSGGAGVFAKDEAMAILTAADVTLNTDATALMEAKGARARVDTQSLHTALGDHGNEVFWCMVDSLVAAKAAQGERTVVHLGTLAQAPEKGVAPNR